MALRLGQLWHGNSSCLSDKWTMTGQPATRTSREKVGINEEKKRGGGGCMVLYGYST